MLYVSPVRQDPQRRAEFFELLLPVEKSAIRGDDQEGTPDVLGLRNVGEQGDGLDGFS